MKNGYKKITNHGSINIPIAMRREIGLQGGDAMEVSMEKGVIMVKPYTPRCIFCGTAEAVLFKRAGKGICEFCACEIKDAYARHREIAEARAGKGGGHEYRRAEKNG